MKIAALIAVCLAAVQLIASTVDFPSWGDFQSPASLHLSKQFIESCYADTATPNIVTAILADYRGFDTMLETIVVFIAAMACFLILREPREECAPNLISHRHSPSSLAVRIPSDQTTAEHGPPEHMRPEISPNVIVITIVRLLIPFIQLFGLYVLAHGHYSPGGGFQAGVIIAASYILLAVSHDLRTMVNRLSMRTTQLLLAGGVLIYFSVGLVGLALGGNFLDYGKLAGLLGMQLASGHSLGILLVEVGVCLTVTAALIIIFKLLSSRGEVIEGL